MKNKIKYYIKSYKIEGLEDWVPSGNIADDSDERIKVTGFSFPEKRFKSKSEADNYIDDYFKRKGYSRG